MNDTKLAAISEGGTQPQASVRSGSSFTSTVVGRIDQVVRRPNDTPKDRKIRVNAFMVAVAIGVIGGAFSVMIALSPMVWTVAINAGALSVISAIVCSSLWWGNVSSRQIAHFFLIGDLLAFGSAHWVGGSWVGSFESAYTVFLIPSWSAFIFDEARVASRYFAISTVIYMVTTSYGYIYEPTWLLEYAKNFEYDPTAAKIITMLMYVSASFLMTLFTVLDKTAKETMQELTEDALIAANEAETVAALATRANEAKTRFLSVMSHEIRNPLTSVVLNVDMLIGTKLSSTQRQYAEGIGRGASVVLNIINDVLDTTKIEAGKVTLEQIDIDIRSTAEFVVQSVAVGAQAKGLDLVLDCHENVPAFVVGDATRLRQILHNLIGNAVKFTREGHVLLRLALDEGGGDAGEPGRELHFVASVEDSGIGIDEEGQKRLFQEFSQVDDSTTRQFGGTGLGLFIVKQLVGLMGGSIHVESSAGLGTTFHFDFYCGVASTKPSRDARHRRTKAQKVQRLKSAPLGGRRLTIAGLFRTKAACDAFVRYATFVANGRADVVAAMRGSEAASAMRSAMAAGSAVVFFADHSLTTPDLYAVSHMPTSVGPTQQKSRQSVGIVVAPSHIGAGDWHLSVGSPLYPAPLSKALARALEVLSGARALADGDVSSSEADAGVKSLRRVRKDVRRDNKAPLILVVDDFESMRDVTCAALTTLGYRTATAVNGQDGVDQLIAADARDDPVDVVIMDIEMPVMDGHEATRTIRALALDDDASGVSTGADDIDDGEGRAARRRMLARTPIIAMTANSLRDDRTRCFEAGMDEFAGKPVSRAKLAEVISAMLDKRAKDVATNGLSEAGGSIASYVDLPQDPEVEALVTKDTLPTKLRVLLADDASDVRTVVAFALKSFGCIVEEHGDGAPAVASYASHPVGYFHLVLFDLHMPDIGGMQGAKEVRMEERRRAAGEAVFMVAVTGEDEGSVGVECARAGFDGVVSKPVSRQALEEVIGKVWQHLRSKGKKAGPLRGKQTSRKSSEDGRGSTSLGTSAKRSYSRSPGRTSRKASFSSSPARKRSFSSSPARRLSIEYGEAVRPARDTSVSKSSSRRRKRSLKAKAESAPDPGEPERRVLQRRSVAATTLVPPKP